MNKHNILFFGLVWLAAYVSSYFATIILLLWPALDDAILDYIYMGIYATMQTSLLAVSFSLIFGVVVLILLDVKQANKKRRWFYSVFTATMTGFFTAIITMFPGMY